MSFLSASSAVIITLLLLIGPLPVARALTRQLVQGVGDGRTALSLLTVALLWLAWQMVIATGLAAVGRFTLYPVLLCELLLLAAGGWLLWRPPQAAQQPVLRCNRVPQTRNFLLPLLTLGYLALLLLGNLLIQPSTDYDSLYYHLPFAANLYTGGALLPDHVPHPVAWYPFGWEALCALLLLPRAGDLLILTPNLLAWTILGLGLYGTMRRLGSAPHVAILPVLLLLSQPLLLDQLSSLRVDLVVAALFMAGVAFTRAGELIGAFPRTLLLLLVICLLVAIKMSGLIYGVLLLGLWAVHEACAVTKRAGDWRQSAKLGRTSWPLLALLGLTFLTTLVWYGRNWLRVGNPLGALAVDLGPWQLFPGTLTGANVRRSTLLALFDSTRLDHWQLFLQALWQKCDLPGLLLLLLASGALVAVTRPKAQLPRRLVFATGAAFMLLWVIYWTTPYSGDDGTFAYQLLGQWVAQSLRFALPALAGLGMMATLGASWFMAQFPRPAQWLTVTVLTVSLLSVAQRSPLYLLAIIVYTVGVLLYLALPRVQRVIRQQWRRWSVTGARPWRSVAVGTALFIVAVLLLPPLQRFHQQRQQQLYGELPALIATLSAPGETIGALATHQSYLAHGPGLQRRVRHLSAAFAAVDTLAERLRDEEISLIIVGPLRPEWQADPLVVALTDAAESYQLLWDGFPARPRLYRRVSP